jgi:Tfp pilus assembly protein PilN
LISTRILTRRRLGTAGVQHAPVRRRRRTRGFVQVASTAAADRLHLNAFGHAYIGLGAAIICVLFYLALAAQITQASYDIARLQDQQRQLLAEQDQLRYQEVTRHAPAEVQKSAELSGLARHNPTRFVTTQAVAIDLQAAIGAPPSDSTPLWQRMVTALVNRVVGAHDVMAAGR